MYSPKQLEKFAADLKLNTARFNDCLENGRTIATVQADYDEAIKMGAQGTPTFLLNGRPLQIQSLDYAEFAQVFNKLLK